MSLSGITKVCSLNLGLIQVSSLWVGLAQVGSLNIGPLQMPNQLVIRFEDRMEF